MRQNILIRTPGGIRRAGALVLGEGLRITETAGGLPQLEGATPDQPLAPGDDIRAALATGRDVHLGPGTFTMPNSIVVGASGKPQRLVGSGTGQTLLHASSPPGPAINVQSNGSVIEGFTLFGIFGPSSFGIQASNLANLALRNLNVQVVAEAGIRLENVAFFEISNVRVLSTLVYGIYTWGVTDAKLWNLSFDGGSTGLYIENGHGVVCESVSAQDCTRYGVRLVGGTSCRLAAVRADNCGTGIALNGNAGAMVGDSLTVANCGRTGILVDQAQDVALNGCRALNTNSPLVIRDSANVVAGAFASESTLPSSPLHVRVERSTGVFLTSARVINGTTPPTHEVDVSQAGSRVLFGPNNFDPARINSGGNFAAL